MKLLSFRYEGKTLFGPKVKKEEAVWNILAIAEEFEDTDFPQDDYRRNCIWSGFR